MLLFVGRGIDGVPCQCAIDLGDSGSGIGERGGHVTLVRLFGTLVKEALGRNK